MNEEIKEPSISINHFKDILWTLGLNSEGFDVELLYKQYLALREGTEEDLLKAMKTTEVNQNWAMHRGFN